MRRLPISWSVKVCISKFFFLNDFFFKFLVHRWDWKLTANGLCDKMYWRGACWPIQYSSYSNWWLWVSHSWFELHSLVFRSPSKLYLMCVCICVCVCVCVCVWFPERFWYLGKILGVHSGWPPLEYSQNFKVSSEHKPLRDLRK